MYLYNGNRLKIEKKTVNLPNGREMEGIIVHPNNAVAVLPIQDGYCYLIRQYRFAIESYIFEVPAGACEPGEDPLNTAHRELIEETGLAAGRIIPCGYIYTTPGYTTEKIWLYTALDLSPSSAYQMDTDEIIELHRFFIPDVQKMIDSGMIMDAKTICLFHQYMRKNHEPE
ncbi:MAG: NUDIX hydrolase [Methanospirillaceae archaeon]|nr:NUDIX hydrolase [Methanospirillaceae archaeon]